jgi:hydroxymethylglutaryl-CoA lyase
MQMPLPKKVKIVEVGPRDGLQNESVTVPVEVRIGLIERLANAGLTVIEAGSFVSPKWVPQMSDSDVVFKGMTQLPNVNYPVLVPNLRGLERALKAGVKEIAIFAAASETFSQKNIHCSIDESINRYTIVVKNALAENLKVRAYISCVLGCPYEGGISANMVSDVARKLYGLGCYEISLGDTVGLGTPQAARLMIDKVTEVVPVDQLAAHFHDTYGQALSNICAVLQQGVAVIDSSVSGLGGCPYAKGASGNVATEDVIHMLNDKGIDTGVDMEKLLDAGKYISDYFGRKSLKR